MTIKFEKRKTGEYAIVFNGEKIGQIDPHNNPKGYYTELWLNDLALADDGGFPNHYRYLVQAKSAVLDLIKQQAALQGVNRTDKRTEGPWFLTPWDNTAVFGKNDTPITQTFPDDTSQAEAEANAALIVNAVNNHATLVSALQTLANDCTLILDGDDMSGMSDGEIFGAMRDTINYALEGVTS